jgi:hypothetical protein
VVKASTLAALGGSAAISQLLAACAGGGATTDELTRVSEEGAYKWSKYPLVEKYNYRNLPWTATPYYDGLSLGPHRGGPNSWDIVRVATTGMGIFDNVVAKKYGPDIERRSRS